MPIRVSHVSRNPSSTIQVSHTAGLVKIAGDPARIKIAMGWGAYLQGQVGKAGHD